MSRWITICFAAIAPASQELSILADDHCSDGHIARRTSGSRLFQREVHPPFVFHLSLSQ
jgi:hypothetical protein